MLRNFQVEFHNSDTLSTVSTQHGLISDLIIRLGRAIKAESNATSPEHLALREKFEAVERRFNEINLYDLSQIMSPAKIKRHFEQINYRSVTPPSASSETEDEFNEIFVNNQAAAHRYSEINKLHLIRSQSLDSATALNSFRQRKNDQAFTVLLKNSTSRLLSVINGLEETVVSDPEDGIDHMQVKRTLLDQKITLNKIEKELKDIEKEMDGIMIKYVFGASLLSRSVFQPETTKDKYDVEKFSSVEFKSK